jgi:hypothetical protein
MFKNFKPGPDQNFYPEPEPNQNDAAPNFKLKNYLAPITDKNFDAALA